jgi:hypothetical protein
MASRFRAAQAQAQIEFQAVRNLRKVNLAPFSLEIDPNPRKSL